MDVIKEQNETISDPATTESEENFTDLSSIEHLQKQLAASEKTIVDTEARCSDLHEQNINLNEKYKYQVSQNEILREELDKLKAEMAEPRPASAVVEKKPSIVVVPNTIQPPKSPATQISSSDLTKSGKPKTPKSPTKKRK